MDLKLLDTNPQLSFRRNSNILQAIIGNLTAINDGFLARHDDCDPSRLQSWLVNATLKKFGKKKEGQLRLLTPIFPFLSSQTYAVRTCTSFFQKKFPWPSTGCEDNRA